MTRKIVVFLLLMLAARIAVGAEIYERKVLFSVRYGSAANEIKVAEDDHAILRGPSTLAVDGKGDILIGGRGSRLVKSFSPGGKLLAMAACDAWHLAACPDGSFFALADYRSKDGDPQGLKVVKYDSHGKLLFSLYPDLFRAVLGDGRADADWPRGIETDSDGNLICLFRGTAARFSSAGKFIEQFPFRYFNARREGYEFNPAFAAPGARISIRRLSAKGDELGKSRLTIKQPELTRGEKLFLSFYDEEATEKALGAGFVDDGGSIYLTGVVETAEPLSLLKGSLRIPGRHIVQKYSPDGKFLSELQFMAEPTGGFPSFEITRKGEIYQLDYHDDRLEVVRWAPRASASAKKK